MLDKAVVRRLRLGVVPGAVLERLSVGYAPLASVIAARLDTLRSEGHVAPLFVRGEWGTGKSHFLTFARCMASKRGVAASVVALNARSAPLNYPQRLYPMLVANLECDHQERGLRALLPAWLRDTETHRRFVDFSRLAAAGDLGWRLRTLDELYGNEELPVHDGEWAWTALLGGDLSWGDYPYKRVQAVERIQTFVLMLRHLGFGGLLVTFDEAETIDQLWNVRSRLVAYDVLGRLISMRGLWSVFGITGRFERAVNADLSRGVADRPETSDAARRFLRSWRQATFEILEPPMIDRQLARTLARHVADLYCAAHPVPRVDESFASSCVAAWAQNPSRDPRRLIRLLVHRLDLLRAITPLAAGTEAGPSSRDHRPQKS